MTVIEINNLSKTYGKKRGISNVNLRVNKGEIFGFIGPNGAGKSTTIKILMNFIFPSSGEAKILGMNCVTETDKIKEKVGYVPSEVRYYDNMTVEELLNYAKSFKNNVDDAYMKDLCHSFDVELTKKMWELSLGNKKKVAIVQALIHKPQLLILDEPTNGLDPLIQQKLFNTLLKIRKEGTTIFLSSHNLTEVEEFCDRVAIIKEGKIIEVRSIEDFVHKRIKRITLKLSKNIEEELKVIGAEGLENEGDRICFNFNGDINKLLVVISKYQVEDLLIEEKKLSEVFMNYYDQEGR
ncbi:putative ABC transporter ATP-binding protein YbhF [Clostridium sp. N3C]|uniref:ABC transporter ATP-binding protein n=1 Tax=Clostridium sp. N3C TaxID=1776758 RepID=UPI00092E1CBB|nr:ABC transporter ATP-binding protein [Clostridium sp. N3C]SCN26365.1 putative ABC transporter ATP-binding protein YbhF [Clostridium sp. N3C]